MLNNNNEDLNELFEKQRKKDKKISLIINIVIVIGILDFILLFLSSIIIGGDAVNGYIQDNTFYVGSHGEYTKVSKLIWYISYYHVISVFITFPFMMVAGVIQNIRKNIE